MQEEPRATDAPGRSNSSTRSSQQSAVRGSIRSFTPLLRVLLLALISACAHAGVVHPVVGCVSGVQLASSKLPLVELGLPGAGFVVLDELRPRCRPLFVVIRGARREPGATDDDQQRQYGKHRQASVHGVSFSACSISSIRSSKCSMPIDRRTRSAGHSVPGPSTLARCSARLSTDPSEVARLNTRRLAVNAFAAVSPPAKRSDIIPPKPPRICLAATA